MDDVELPRLHGTGLDLDAIHAVREEQERMARHLGDDMRGQPKDCLALLRKEQSFASFDQLVYKTDGA